MTGGTEAVASPDMGGMEKGDEPMTPPTPRPMTGFHAVTPDELPAAPMLGGWRRNDGIADTPTPMLTPAPELDTGTALTLEPPDRYAKGSAVLGVAEPSSLSASPSPSPSWGAGLMAMEVAEVLTLDAEKPEPLPEESVDPEEI